MIKPFIGPQKTISLSIIITIHMDKPQFLGPQLLPIHIYSDNNGPLSIVINYILLR